MTTMTYNSLLTSVQDYLDREDDNLVANIPTFISFAEIRCAREVKNLGFKKVVVSAFQAGQYVYEKPNRWLQTISFNFGKSTAYATTLREAASGVRTLTLAAAHNFSVGDSISVFNVGGTAYNGNFTITATTQYTITYSSGSATESSTEDTGGIVTAPLEERQYLLPKSYDYCTSYWPDRTQTEQPRFYSDYDYTNFFVVPTPDISYPFELSYYEKPIPLSETNQTNWLTENAPDMLLYATLLEAVPYLKNDPRIAVWKDYYMQSSTAIKGENKNRVNDDTIQRSE